jgi:hypothetical protein
MDKRLSRSGWATGAFLALLPVGSYLSQYFLSVKAGTDALLSQHLTISIVDWIFVPFNLIVIHAIDWRRGAVIYAVTVISVVLNVVTHAFWQYNLIEGGHMINHEQVVLPAGWVHVIFSTVETSLLAAFILAGRPCYPYDITASILAICYFLAAGVCGYLMNNGFMITDVLMVSIGLFFVLIYPMMIRSPVNGTG